MFYPKVGQKQIYNLVKPPQVLNGLELNIVERNMLAHFKHWLRETVKRAIPASQLKRQIFISYSWPSRHYAHITSYAEQESEKNAVHLIKDCLSEIWDGENGRGKVWLDVHEEKGGDNLKKKMKRAMHKARTIIQASTEVYKAKTQAPPGSNGGANINGFAHAVGYEASLMMRFGRPQFRPVKTFIPVILSGGNSSIVNCLKGLNSIMFETEDFFDQCFRLVAFCCGEQNPIELDRRCEIRKQQCFNELIRMDLSHGWRADFFYSLSIFSFQFFLNLNPFVSDQNFFQHTYDTHLKSDPCAVALLKCLSYMDGTEVSKTILTRLAKEMGFDAIATRLALNVLESRDVLHLLPSRSSVSYRVDPAYQRWLRKNLFDTREDLLDVSFLLRKVADLNSQRKSYQYHYRFLSQLIPHITRAREYHLNYQDDDRSLIKSENHLVHCECIIQDIFTQANQLSRSSSRMLELSKAIYTNNSMAYDSALEFSAHAYHQIGHQKAAIAVWEWGQNIIQREPRYHRKNTRVYLNLNLGHAHYRLGDVEASSRYVTESLYHANRSDMQAYTYGHMLKSQIDIAMGNEGAIENLESVFFDQLNLGYNISTKNKMHVGLALLEAYMTMGQRQKLAGVLKLLWTLERDAIWPLDSVMNLRRLGVYQAALIESSCQSAEDQRYDIEYLMALMDEYYPRSPELKVTQTHLSEMLLNNATDVLSVSSNQGQFLVCDPFLGKIGYELETQLNLYHQRNISHNSLQIQYQPIRNHTWETLTTVLLSSCASLMLLQFARYLVDAGIDKMWGKPEKGSPRINLFKFSFGALLRHSMPLILWNFCWWHGVNFSADERHIPSNTQLLVGSLLCLSLEGLNHAFSKSYPYANRLISGVLFIVGILGTLPQGGISSLSKPAVSVLGQVVGSFVFYRGAKLISCPRGHNAELHLD